MAKRTGTIKHPTGEAGYWRASAGVVYVSCGKLEKSADVGGFALDPGALARILLDELLSDAAQAASRRSAR